jgi:selenocysteine lyase/cysteine desulfurase
MPAVRVYGPGDREERAPVVSISVEGYDPQDFAAALDSAFGVQCRAGLHCAPRMHAALGTLPRGGTVRFSCGWSTTRSDIDRALEAVASIAGA